VDATVAMDTTDTITDFARFRFSVNIIITVMVAVALDALCQSLV